MSSLPSGSVFLVVLISALVLMFDEVICKEGSKERNSRFVSFETTDDDIKISLDFSIPFVSIPVKKTLESSTGSSDILSQFPTVNINLAGILMGGAAVLGSTFVLPFLLRTIAVDHSDGPHHPYARFLDNTEFEGDDILNSINKLMTADNNIFSCIQRFVCWTAKKASYMMTRPHASQTTYILNEIARFLLVLYHKGCFAFCELMRCYVLIITFSNSLFNSLLNGTAVEGAIKSGHEGHNCSATYSECPVSDVNMRIFMANLSKLGKL